MIVIYEDRGGSRSGWANAPFVAEATVDGKNWIAVTLSNQAAYEAHSQAFAAGSGWDYRCMGTKEALIADMTSTDGGPDDELLAVVLALTA